MRFVQYAARFACFHMLKADPTSEQGKKLQLFYKAVGLHRKAFKIGMFMDEYLKLKEALLLKDGPSKILKVLLRLCMTLFLVFDNMIWFLSIKVINGDKDTVKKRSYYLRFFAAVFNTCLVLQSYQETNVKLGKSQDQKTLDKQGSNVVAMIKNTCDLLTYGSNTKLISFLALDDGQMGLFGAISAIAGGFPVWLKL